MHDRYTVARGATGDVVVAHDEQLGRTVAIKRMRETAPTERAMQQFFREARIQGRLDHPSIAPIYEVGRDGDGRPYFAMRNLAGATLAEVLATGGASTQRLLRAFVDACRAIEYAHARGVVHGALAPARLLLGDFGETYVIEWSRAELIEERGAPARDLLALGAILFELLAGAPPAAGELYPAQRAPGRGIAPELDALCAWALAAAPTDRTSSARDLADRMQQFLDQRAAADLVARIMVPPAELPAEIAAAVAQDNLAVHRRTARFVAIANFGFLAFVPLLLTGGKQHPVLVGLMCVLVAANAMLLAWAVRGGPVAARWVRLAVSVLLTALVCRITSPFLLGTPLAAVTCIGLVGATFHVTREVVIVGIALTGAVLAPWIAEVAGWLSPTMQVDGSRLTIDSPMLAGSYTIIGGLVVYAAVIVAVACVLTRGLRIAEGSARLQLHLQAWQLRQLVPG